MAAPALERFIVGFDGSEGARDTRALTRSLLAAFERRDLVEA